MSVFAILAAGRGSRNRSGIHKALLPVDGKAALSHLFDLAPTDSRLVVILGDRGEQIRDYCRLAHPHLDITFVDISDYDQPGSGPGTSLHRLRDLQGEDLSFTTCDTLWARNDYLWEIPGSWLAVSDIPAGTKPERWCRISDNHQIFDKTPGTAEHVWTGLARITAEDLPLFWFDLVAAPLVDGERQVSGGFTHLDFKLVDIAWTDIGDQDAYRNAVGYDSTKPAEATYIFDGRVIKLWADSRTATRRVSRATDLYPLVPQIVDSTPNMLTYRYVAGVSGYEAAGRSSAMLSRLIDWLEEELWHPVDADLRADCLAFYRDKTWMRVGWLPAELRNRCSIRLEKIDWDLLAAGARPSRFHGDLTLANLIMRPDGSFLLIDWREDFNGRPYGDRRYDEAKLLTSTLVHWEHARHGDFRPWGLAGPTAKRLNPAEDVKLIAGLCLLNSAPLHVPPFDQILVERGCQLLDRL